MRNRNSYWKKRVEAEMEARLASSDTISSQMKSLHHYYFSNIQKEIESFYQRYADKNGLSKADAKKRVSEFDVEAFSDKAARYVREKDFSARANSELALYNLKMKVSRLELLQYHLDLEMVALADEEKKLTERFLKAGYVEEVRFQAGILAETVVNPKQLRDISEAIINAPFKGAMWSDNIWKRQEALREILQEEIRGAILKGRNPVELIPRLRKEFEVSYQHARRLAITEYARVQSEVQKVSMKTNGFEKYVYLAESGACKICASLDDRVYLVDEMQPGENCAPMHPHCRCSTAPVFEKNVEKEYNQDRDYKAAGVEIERALQKQSDNAWRKLLGNEQNALQEYTGPFSGQINRYLRNQRFPDDIEMDAYYDIPATVKMLDNALNNNQLGYDLQLFRHIDYGEFIALQQESEFKSYVSTSISEYATDNFGEGYKLVINSPKETKGFYVGEHSTHPSEKEFMVARNTKYKILNVDRDRGILELELIVDE